MLNNTLPQKITNIKIKGHILKVYHPYTEDFDPHSGSLVSGHPQRKIHYCILVKITRYSDNTCSAVVIPGTSKKINLNEIGKLIVSPDHVYHQNSLTTLTKFIIRPSNMMILQLDSKYFQNFDNGTQKFTANHEKLLDKDIDRINEYLNNPQIIELINDLLVIKEGTIPEDLWNSVKYIPINAYLD